MNRMTQILLPLLLWPLTLTAEEDALLGKLHDSHSKRSVENINNTTEIFRDPSIAIDNVKNTLNQMTATSGRNTTEPVAPEAGNVEAKTTMQDPTQMTDNFRTTLRKMSLRGKRSETDEIPSLPNISLSAISFSAEKDNFAMLKINDNTILVKVGDNGTFIDKKELIRITVQEINQHEVILIVYPANEIIILR